MAADSLLMRAPLVLSAGGASVLVAAPAPASEEDSEEVSVEV